MAIQTQVVLILTLLICSTLCAVRQNNSPSLTLYNYDPPRHTFSVTLNSSTPTLPAELLGAYYLCSTGGVWFLYQDAENYAKNGYIQAVADCRTRKGTFPIKSVWLLESSKYPHVPTVNLFSERFWANPESASAYYADQPSYTGEIRSFAGTGTQAVTFYTEENYKGRSVCVEPRPEHTMPFVGHFEYITGIKAGQVKSFRIGCYSVHRISDKGFEERIPAHLKG